MIDYHILNGVSETMKDDENMRESIGETIFKATEGIFISKVSIIAI